MHRTIPCDDVAGEGRQRLADRRPSPPTPSFRPDGPARPSSCSLLAAALALGLALGCGHPAAATERSAGPPPDAGAAAAAEDPVAALRTEVDALKRAYEARIAALEARIAELEARQGAETPTETAAETGQAPEREQPTGPADEPDELAALRAAARAAAGGQEPPATATPAAGAATGEISSGPREATFGRERNLNRLNPEISMTGNIVGIATDAGREEFQAKEFELNLQSALDPFSSTKWTLSVNEEGVDVEEGYIDYSALGHGLTLTAGKFRQSFGVLNRWHSHALPQVDYPLVIQSYLGEEGLAQTGLSLDWVLPHGWADTNSLTVQVTDASADVFGGKDFQHLSTLAHLSNYWDLSPSTYFELGLSGVDGETAEGGTARVWGSDLTLDWAPPGRAKYREVRWRTELMRSERDDATGLRQDAWGGYSYLEGLLTRNLWAGVRYDRVEDSLDPSRVREAIVPYVTWWQSEFVRLRGEYRMFDEGLGAGNRNAFTLQLTWAAGPHKHENY